MSLIFKTVILLTFIITNAKCGAIDKNEDDMDAIMFPGDEKINLNSRSNFYAHHHHHHHHDHPIRDDKILNTTPNQATTSINEIPLSLIQQLNEIDNITVLLENYLEGEEKLVEDIGIASRFGTLERAAAKMPKLAKCEPTLQTVELKVSSDPSLFIYPSCTRVERCGGCCSHSLLSCQPVETEILTYQVLVSQYTGGIKLNAKQKEIVFVEKHTKCKCDCIIKKEDCNSFQEYRKDDCRCICTNLDEKKKCEKFNDTKLWDPNICKCRCREISDCSTGFYYDQNKCECLSIPVRRRFADLYSSQERNFSDKEKYDIETPAVSPLQENIENTE